MEIRYDAVSGKAVIISQARENRPMDVDNSPNTQVKQKEEITCPFCPGNESSTPVEEWKLEDENGWLIRVVENKFPALNKNLTYNEKEEGLFKWGEAAGIHEVIIEHTNHHHEFFNYSIEEFKNIIIAYKERMQSLYTKDSIEFVAVFKNHGKTAGASLKHPHSQIIATPFIPPDLREELEGSKSYYENNGQCIFCSIIEEELKLNKRIILEDENYVVISPYAAKMPYQMSILPKSHQERFENLKEEEVDKLATVIYKLSSSILNNLGNIPFNLYIHTSPKGNYPYFHWHMEIVPRLPVMGGFELATGIFVNSNSPEKCAEILKVR